MCIVGIIINLHHSTDLHIKSKSLRAATVLKIWANTLLALIYLRLRLRLRLWHSRLCAECQSGVSAQIFSVAKLFTAGKTWQKLQCTAAVWYELYLNQLNCCIHSVITYWKSVCAKLYIRLTVIHIEAPFCNLKKE